LREIIGQRSRAGREIMAVAWDDIAFVPDPGLADEAQAAWSWLVPGPWRVLVCARIGGIFLEAEAGQVRWLDIGTGSVEDVAESTEAFDALLRSDDPVVEEWFLPGLVEALHEAEKRPGPGEAYWAIIPPVFAEGKYTPDNMAVVPIREQLLGSADIHKQIADMPDGAKVRFTVD
jgi:hypothetical protein